MPSVGDVIEVNVRATGAGLGRASFGIPLILGVASAWLTGSQGDRIRSYSSLTAVALDFDTDAPEYLVAAKVFGQTPRPSTLMIGLRANKPTEVRTITITAVAGATYRLTVDGTSYTYVARSGDTAADIAAALVAPAWAANTAYVATHGEGRFVTKSGKLYRCFTGGTSWNGPQAHSNNISDGTAAWNYLSTPGVRANATAYSLNDSIAVNSNRWRCTTAGTSDDPFPAGLSAGSPASTVTDGTVVWTLVSATWASGTAYTANTSYIYTAGGVFKCATTGTSYAGPSGTSTTPQTEPSGVAWVYVSTGATLATDSTVTAAVSDDDPGILILTSNDAGQFVSFQLNDFALMELFCDNDHVDVAADLNALLLASKSWWTILSPFGCATDLLDISAWCEANERFFLPCSQDSAIATQAPPAEPPEDTTPSPTLNVAYVKSLRAYNFSADVAFHHDNSQFMTAAWAGSTLPLAAGSETWKFRTLTGVTPTPLTESQLAHVRGTKQEDGTFAGGNHANGYVQMTQGDSGISITLEGTLSGTNKYIDVTRGIASLRADIQTGVFNLLVQMAQTDGKPPYTNNTLAAIVGRVNTILKDYAKTTRQFFQSTPAPSADCPTVEEIIASNPTAYQGRSLPDVTFSGLAAGAIHGVKIAGTVALS